MRQSKAAPSEAKGGGDKWLKMAGAMDAALDRMRAMYEILKYLQDFHSQCDCAQNPANWKPLLEETAEVANILKVGLKAR